MSSQRIQHLREEFEYTQEFVAEYLECSRSTYANWSTNINTSRSCNTTS